MTRILLLFFLFAFISNSVLGQTDCENTLNHATTEFEAGRFYGIPAILKPCIDNGFSNEQKVRAYLLLTQTYLLIDDPISAENSYLQLLEADPEYVANPQRDPIDVYYLSKKFTTVPIFTPSFQGGINTSFVRTIHSLNTSSSLSQLKINNGLKAGFQLGGTVDWNINNRWSIGLGLMYAHKSFKSVQDDFNEGTRREFIEKQDWLDIPLYIKYGVDSGRIRPFVYAGIAANLLLGSKISPEEIDLNSPSSGTQQVSQSPDHIITGSRHFLNRSLVFGGGFKYKVGKNFFTFDLRYMAGLNNLTSNVYDNKLMTGFEYSSDYFRLDNLSFSIGYIKPLYKPRKKKQAGVSLLNKLGLKKK